MSSIAQARWRFPGGLRLSPHKDEATGDGLAALPVPARLVLPLTQHAGEAAQPLVKTGEHVRRGQLIAGATDYLSAPVHASSSGRVADIGEHAIAHPSGLPSPCIVIDTDGQDEAVSADALPEWATAPPGELLRRIREAGIVGLGGAAFPTFVKLDRGGHAVNTLIINGAECEPWISCDQTLMQDAADTVITGAAIMAHALQVERCLIALEDSKPEVQAALSEALAAADHPALALVAVPTVYPEGGEKQLIQVLTGREVPAGGLPQDIGMLCQNVGTAAAVHDAICLGEPLISRIVTITGNGIARPGNFRVRLGTPIAELVAAAGGYTAAAERLIIGGPMMGYTLPDDAPAITKATNCILVLGGDQLADEGEAMPCIRCGECMEVCPAGLLPQQLYWHARAGDHEQLQAYNLFDCIECGCCALVCPSHIPLVQYYRAAKTDIWSQQAQRRTAQRARQRYTAREQRLAQQHEQQQARLKREKEAVAADSAKRPEKARDVIEAARQRARARKKDGGNH